MSVTVTHLTTQSAQAYSAANGSNTFQTLSFANSNGVSFSTGTQGIYASVAAGGGAQTGISGLSAGTTQMTSGTAVFSNSNGISFGVNGNTVTASYTVPSTAGLLSAINISGGTTSNNLSAVTFSNSNGVSFGLNGSVMTATVKTDYQSSNANYLTSQSNQAVSANNGSYAFQTLSFSNANGVSFGTSAGSAITASHNGLTTARASNDAIGLNTAQSNVTWTVNSSGLSFDARGYAGTTTAFNGTNASASMTLNSNGLRLDLSAAAGAGGGVAIANSQTTYTSGTANLVVAGGAMTIASTTGQSFNFSVPATSSIVGVGAITISTNGSTISISGGTVAAAPVNFSAGTTSNNLGSVVFSNSGGVSFGLNGSTLTASVLPNIAISAGTTSNQNFSTLVFSNSNGVSFGLNGSTMTASVPLNVTMSKMNFLPFGQYSSSQQINSRVSFRYLQVLQDVSFSRVDIPMNFSVGSTTTSNTAAVAISSVAVLYTRNGSTLNPIVGASGSTTYSYASNTANYSSVIGGRLASFGLATALTPGDYWLGAFISTNTSSVGAATTNLGATVSMFIGSTLTAQNFAEFGEVTSASTTGLHNMQGLCSISISNTTMTYQQSQITASGASGMRGNIHVIFRNY